MSPRIAIVGSGNVGGALHKAFATADLDVALAPRDPEAMRRAVQERDVVVLAIPFAARRGVVDTLGSALRGKIVLDVTNPLRFPGPELDTEGPESGAEELQRWVPEARVVKAFNTVFYPFMTDPRMGGERMSMFAASDDEAARHVALDLGRAIGFDAVDAGPLWNARGLEMMLLFEMRLEKQHGSRIGFRLLRG